VKRWLTFEKDKKKSILEVQQFPSIKNLACGKGRREKVYQWVQGYNEIGTRTLRVHYTAC
jgi:hypothetical protein